MRGRNSRRWVSALTGVVALGLVFVSLGTSRPADAAPVAATPSVHSPHATIGGNPVWAHFTDPTTSDDYTIINEFIRLVEGTPRGGVIQGSIFLISLDSVAQALVDAQERGVTVKVAMDGGDESKTWSGITTIKKLHNRTFCHNKNGGTPCIRFGSANFVVLTGTQRFNNTITVYGDEALKRGLDADFADQYAQSATSLTTTTPPPKRLAATTSRPRPTPTSPPKPPARPTPSSTGSTTSLPTPTAGSASHRPSSRIAPCCSAR